MKKFEVASNNYVHYQIQAKIGTAGKKKKKRRSSHCGSAVTNLTSIHENAGLSLDLAQWVKDLVLL